MSDLGFDDLLRWLDGRLGRTVALSLGGPADGFGNTQVTVCGALARTREDVTLIDPSPGRVELFAVGDGAVVVLLEGDFVAAEGSPDGEPAHIVADFGELAFTVSCDQTEA